jgi:hypothetical protein
MMRVHSSRGLVGCVAIASLAIALIVLPGSAAAMRSSGELAPRLAKLASPSLRDAPPAKQARALGLSTDGLARRGRRLLVDVRFESGALTARDELEAAGARPVAASGRYQTVTVSALPSRLRAIARVPGVEGVAPVLAPLTAAATCPSGAIVSEGDIQLKAEAARQTNPGIDGTDVTVGILSDSFDQATGVAKDAAEDVESGDLPGVNGCPNTAPVTLVGEEDERADPSDEGRAMAQIVHDLAPGAELKFATAFNSEISYANNIRALSAAGAKVIVDDVFWPGEPFFQDGPIAVAVREVVEDGAAYFSAAGNNNLIDGEGNDIASWETPAYRDAGSCPAAVRAVPGVNPVHCLDFNPGLAVDKTFGIKVEAGETLTVDLQWDEPWYGVGTDLDAFLLNSTGSRIAESVEDNVIAPVEVLKWSNTSGGTRTVQLVVNRFSGASPPLKFAFLQNCCGVEATEYSRSSGQDVVGPTIFGHSGTASAISTGAIRFDGGPGLEPEPEPYSSRGPVRHDFGPVESTVPAELLASPETLSKPDLIATDCGKTTFFSSFTGSFWRFCGTSAAAPHAAAVAALMLDAEPAAGPEDVRGALYGSAEPVAPYGACAIGAGLVEAVDAVGAAKAKTGGAGPLCEAPESKVDPEQAAAAGDWGSENPPPVTNGGGPTTTTPPIEPVRVSRPRTFFLQRPAKVVRTVHRRAKVVFLFGSNEPGVSFACRIDGGLFRRCSTRLVRRFPLGWHTVKVAALDAVGNGDKTPASYRFKVKRVR